jgi:predicted TIM-barrel fold metal-dependent hydrolase
VHLWDFDRIDYPWLKPPFREDVPGGSPEPIATTYRLENYLAEARAWNVAGIVHVEAGADADHALAETDWLEELADAQGMPNGIIAHVALDRPEAEHLLAEQASRPRVRGIRHIVGWHPDATRSYLPRDISTDPLWQRGFSLLARHDLSFDLQAYPGQFETLAGLFAAHDVPVIVNHLGMPVPSDKGGMEEWSTGLRHLAQLPHVTLKLSGAGFMGTPWNAATARDAVLRAIDLFGPERVLVATNFPTDRLFATMDQTLAAYAELTAGFAEHERRAMWGRNANRIYRLGLDI